MTTIINVSPQAIRRATKQPRSDSESDSCELPSVKRARDLKQTRETEYAALHLLQLAAELSTPAVRAHYDETQTPPLLSDSGIDTDDESQVDDIRELPVDLRVNPYADIAEEGGVIEKEIHVNPTTGEARHIGLWANHCYWPGYSNHWRVECIGFSYWNRLDQFFYSQNLDRYLRPETTDTLLAEYTRTIYAVYLVPFENSEELLHLQHQHAQTNPTWKTLWTLPYDQVKHCIGEKEFEQRRLRFFSKHVQAMWRIDDSNWLLHLTSNYVEFDRVAASFMCCFTDICPAFFNNVTLCRVPIRNSADVRLYPWDTAAQAIPIIRSCFGTHITLQELVENKRRAELQ